jgi:RNA polymerase sigma-70 factor (ECF subfamily)
MTDKANLERESRWVLLAQSGNREAFDALLKAVQKPLYHYIISIVREPHSAEDILQEVFVRIYRKLVWLREPKIFRSWAYRIASRETFRYLKRERRWAEQERDETVLKTIPLPPKPEEFEPELVEQLPRMVAALSPASRAVIVLYYLHEMSLAEVSEVLEIPLGTVKSRLAYGIESLRGQFDKQKLFKGRS